MTYREHVLPFHNPNPPFHLNYHFTHSSPINPETMTNIEPTMDDETSPNAYIDIIPHTPPINHTYNEQLVYNSDLND